MLNDMNKFFSFVFMLAVSLATSAQTARIVGQVLDAQSRQPVPYAYLRIEGTSSGSQTNLDGAYTLSVPREGRVIVSSMGYRTDTVAIAKLRKQSTVRLEPSPVKLSSVAVTEYTKPSSVLREVVRRIGENYWTDTTVGTFFHRKYSLTSDSLWLFNEAVAEVLRPGYDKQYYRKTGLVVVDMKGELDSIRHAGNHKRFLRGRLLVYDTAMLRTMLGDSVYQNSPFVGVSQTIYNETRAFYDLMQVRKGNFFLSGKREGKIDRRSTLKTFEDADGRAYYVITSVNEKDSTSIIVDRADMALVHYYNTSLHADTVLMPYPLNKIIGGAFSPYRYSQYDYAKINGRYTMVFCLSASAIGIIPPKKALLGGKINREIRKLTTDDVVEYYSLWSLIDLRPADHGYLDTTETLPIETSKPYPEVFGRGDSDTAFWSGYNVIPIEQRIADKLRTARKQ